MGAKDFIALAAVIATGIGWIVTYLSSAAQSRRGERLKTSLKHIEAQLQELYGPVAFLIWEGERTWKDLFDTLQRLRGGERPKAVFPLRGQDELDLWLFWVENDLLPRNEQVRVLLMSKTHLIEGPTMPQSYLRFLEHHNSWKINHLRWTKEKVQYAWHSEINYPQEFAQEVLSTFATLKARYEAFLETLSKTAAEPKQDSPHNLNGPATKKR